MPDINKTDPDLYGQEHPVETPELIDSKLAEFDQEVPLLEGDKAAALREAENQCPELLTRDFKLKFLRAEVFNVDLALKRYQKYWKQRLRLFGPEKAFQPLTLRGAMSEDVDAIRCGHAQLCPMKDPSGRTLILMDPSRVDMANHTRESTIRVLWYITHAAIENEETEKHGVLFCWYLDKFRLSQWDSKGVRLMFSTMVGAIPIRFSAAHTFQPPSYVKPLIPVMLVFLGQRLRKRVKFYYGSPEKIAKTMEDYGLTKELLPTELGGKVSLCVDKWVEQRFSLGK